MTIHVYGDSFGQNTQKDTWPHELSILKKEELISYALGGTGPGFTLQLLIADLEENKISSQDTVIVLLSDHKRVVFPFLKKPEHAGGAFRVAEDEEWIHPFTPAGWKSRGRGPGVTEDQSYLYDHKEDIKMIAQSLGPMFLYESVKNITFLHLISQNFKSIRFVVFTCFSLENYISYYKNFGVKSTKFLHDLKFEGLDQDNFDYVKIPISHMVGTDGDQNHMSVENNKNFAQFVYDIIMYKKPDTSWFDTKSIYTCVEEDDRNNEPHFIYE